MKAEFRNKIHILTSVSIAAVLFISTFATVNNYTGIPSAAAEEEPRFLDELFLQIETKIPGFAGYYYDDDERLNVYLTQPVGILDVKIKDVLSRHLDASVLEKGIIVKQANYSWKIWDAWRNTLNEYAIQGENGIELLDIDERSQKLMIGLSKLEEQRDEVEAFLEQNDIPVEAVRFVESGPAGVYQLRGGDYLDLLPSLFGQFCTNGFIAELDGETVAVTAGHCEIVADDTGDQEYEFEGDLAGEEIAGTNPTGIRYSDSLLFDPVVDTAIGEIFKTSTTHYTITGKKLFPAQGEAVCKMGVTTDETCGAVQTTGVNLFGEEADPYETLWMMALADFDADHGDSGGPVYKKLGNDEVTLYGIVRGFTTIAQTTYRTFSPMNNIEADQGTLTVTGSSSGGIGIRAKDINTGQQINGLFASVYDDNGNLLASGYTPFYLNEVAHGDTYHIDYSNYGDYYFTSTDSSNDWYVANWGGGRVSVVGDDSQVKYVYGIYYDRTNPGNYVKMTYEAKDTNGNAISGMYGGFKDINGNVQTQGYTPYTVGVKKNFYLETIWNNYGTKVYQYADLSPNSGTEEISDTTTAWGGIQELTLTGSGPYTTTGRYTP